MAPPQIMRAYNPATVRSIVGELVTAHLANTLQDAGLERYDILARLPKLWQS